MRDRAYSGTGSVQYLLTLPPVAVDHFKSIGGRLGAGWFVCSDPPDRRLGSGGGTAHLLQSAWSATGGEASFKDWLRKSKKLIIHGGGQSRRLPAYAAMGKPFIPIPVMRWSYGQRLNQSLFDLQSDTYNAILHRSPSNTVAMVTNGDVLIGCHEEPPLLPEADVIILGMKVPPEIARHFGVLLVSRERPDTLVRFLQKPSADEIRRASQDYSAMVDTGVWLLSEKAALALMKRCGWDAKTESFVQSAPLSYELYSQFGLALGENPVLEDATTAELKCTAIELRNADFYHFGTSRQMIESVCALQNLGNGEGRIMSQRFHPDMITQNSLFEPPSHKELNHTLWVENSFIPSTWTLSSEHVLTGIPENEWSIQLERGVCIDIVPIGENEFCLRPYGIDDPFKGEIGSQDTHWFQRPVAQWFKDRRISMDTLGVDGKEDIQNAPLFPVLNWFEVTSEFVTWMFAAKPTPSEKQAGLWVNAKRLSAQEIGDKANLERLETQRSRYRLYALEAIHTHRRSSVFYRLDLEHTAKLFAESDIPIPEEEDDTGLSAIHEHMWRARILKERGSEAYVQEEEKAFASLRDFILSATLAEPSHPVCNIMPDQIVWGRAPVRLDLAGGWTDTPPYCLMHGGKVTNVAVNLNGQPPLQAYAKLRKEPEIVIRSIDLGAEERIRTWEELDTYNRPGSEFALAKAALALTGFSPRFHCGAHYSSLRQQLEAFGGGIEVSLLAAIPQGSGLGTSSILASTMLQTLSELCGLHWDTQTVINRTLTLEQLLTTGGGWQDQIGGVLHGVKYVQSAPGASQDLVVRWLPERLFTGDLVNRQILLYYTGITRLAKNILQEIVRGMFLNSQERLKILREIGANADFTADAIQRADFEGLCEAVRRSWDLNQMLDSGSNPPPVQSILDKIEDFILGGKLLGAGGGGYLLLFAKDAEAGYRIRRELTENPPNDRARFVDISVSQTGLETTRS
jgi:galactokinase/mevalonate kinase-like predicted kinase